MSFAKTPQYFTSITRAWSGSDCCFVRGKTKEDFVWLVTKQTSATAQPVLSSEPDFCHLLQPLFSLCCFYGLLKFAQWVLSPKEVSRTCSPCKQPSTLGPCPSSSSQIARTPAPFWSFVTHRWWYQVCPSAELCGVKHRVLHRTTKQSPGDMGRHMAHVCLWLHYTSLCFLTSAHPNEVLLPVLGHCGRYLATIYSYAIA